MSKFIFQTTIDPTANQANNRLLNVPCDASVFVGAWVRMTGAGIAVNALADTVANSNVIGIVEEKPTTTTCNIRFLGLTIQSLDLSTIHGVLDETKDYFLSETSAGLMTIVAPTATGEVIVKLGQPFSTARFLVRVGDRIVRK